MHVLGQLDIRAEDDVPPVERAALGLAQLGKLLLDLRLLDLQLAVLPERVVGGIDDDQAVVAIEQHVIAGARRGC